MGSHRVGHDLSDLAAAGVGCHFLLQCMKVKSESEIAQFCLGRAEYFFSPSLCILIVAVHQKPQIFFVPPFINLLSAFFFSLKGKTLILL